MAKFGATRAFADSAIEKQFVLATCYYYPLRMYVPYYHPPSNPAQAKKDGSFTILQFNANGIGNRVMELANFLEQHNVKVAVIQELKLTRTSKTPSFRTTPQYEGTDVTIKEEVYSPWFTK